MLTLVLWSWCTASRAHPQGNDHEHACALQAPAQVAYLSTWSPASEDSKHKVRLVSSLFALPGTVYSVAYFYKVCVPK